MYRHRIMPSNAESPPLNVMSRIVSYTWVSFVCKLYGEVDPISLQINTLKSLI
jgi:hypothetical protein